jgi:hypothetical protein
LSACVRLTRDAADATIVHVHAGLAMPLEAAGDVRAQGIATNWRPC